MKYMTIKCPDIANGPGCRVSLFVSGCPHHCKGCFNEETWDFNAGNEFTEETIDYILSLCNQDFISGFTILGGEPLCPENIDCVTHILKKVYENTSNNKVKNNIWVYTGYLYEELVRRDGKFPDYIKYIDVIVDGPFIESKKDISLQFRGSDNQRLIKVRQGNYIFIPEAFSN